MKHVRFSLTTALVGITLLGLAFGALESESQMVGSVVYTANLGLLCLAAVGAAAARGGGRVFWLGFAVFGWVYSAAAFGWLSAGRQFNPYPYMWVGVYQTRNEGPDLATTNLLDLYGRLRTPKGVGSRVTAQWSGGGFWPATIDQVDGSRYRVVWDDSSPPEWVGASQIQPQARDLTRVGHSIFSLLIGLAGGVACWYLFADRRIRQAASPGA
jgi:hypothetical protein